MKAVQLHSVGVGIEGLALVDVADPTPGEGEVLVQVHVVSASRLELSAIGGRGLGAGLALPRTLGGDPAGQIVSVGPGVSSSRIGELVVVKPNLFCGECDDCADGHEADCRNQSVLGLHRDGGAASFVVVPCRNAFAVPTGVSAADASAAVHTVAVALHMIRVAGGIANGDDVLVTGAAGAVGSAAVQVVSALGGKAFAVVQDVDQAAYVARLAPSVVVRLDQVGLEAGVRALVPAGVRLAIDTTGVAAVLSAAVDALGWRGHAVTCAGTPEPRAEIDASALYRLRRTLHGSAASDVADVHDSLNLVASGAVRPQIGVRLPLSQYRDAFTALADPTRNGRVVLEVSS